MAKGRCHELPGPPVTHCLAVPSGHWEPAAPCQRRGGRAEERGGLCLPAARALLALLLLGVELEPCLRERPPRWGTPSAPAVSERGFWQVAWRPLFRRPSGVWTEAAGAPGAPEMESGASAFCAPEPVGSAACMVAPRAAALLRGWGGPCREPEIGFVQTSQIRADWAGTGAICDPGACSLPVGAPGSLCRHLTPALVDGAGAWTRRRGLGEAGRAGRTGLSGGVRAFGGRLVDLPGS